MSEFEKHLKLEADQEIVESVIPEKKELYMGSMKIQKGHKLFKMELATSLISEVPIEYEDTPYVPDDIELGKRKAFKGEKFIFLISNVAKENKRNKRMKLIREDGFIYASALNKKNALKRFINMLSM